MQHDNKYYRQVKLLVQILPIIAEENIFALKGGTALNLFLRDLPRLSVDIDLTYLPISNREDSITTINNALEQIFQKIQKQNPTSKIVLAKTCKLFVKQQGIQVKIEVNTVLRGSVHPPELISVSPRTEEEFGYVEMQLLAEDELYAGKICAALDRQHPRDLFDIQYFLSNHEYSNKLVDTFIAYLISHKRPINEVLFPNFIDISLAYQSEFFSMTDTPVTLEELLNAREQLIETLHKNLSDKHKAFLVSFKRKQPDWSLLDLKNVDQLPAVRWKQTNLENMSDVKYKLALKQLIDKIEML